MSVETKVDSPPSVQKSRRRSWFQFSLRTLFVLTFLVALPTWLAMSEIEVARKKEAALLRLEAGGFVVISADDQITPRWFTKWFISDEQWKKWFPHGDFENIAKIKIEDRIGEESHPSPLAITKPLPPMRELFATLDAFQSCREIEIGYDISEACELLAADMQAFRKWETVESLQLRRCTPTPECLRHLASAGKLKKLLLTESGEVDRAALAELLAKTPIEYLGLQLMKLTGDSPIPIRNTLKTVFVDRANVTWDDIADWLADNPVDSLSCHTLHPSATKPWNSQTLQTLHLPSLESHELALMGDFPALDTIHFGIDMSQPGRFPDRLAGSLKLSSVFYIGPLNSNIVEGLGKLHSIRSLWLTASRDSDCSLEGFASLKNLDFLTFYRAGVELSPSEATVLRDLPRLQTAHFDGDRVRQTIEAMATLSGSKSLKHLRFYATEDDDVIHKFLRTAGTRGILVSVRTPPDVRSGSTQYGQMSSRPYLK